jgi:hypothetical protein
VLELERGRGLRKTGSREEIPQASSSCSNCKTLEGKMSVLKEEMKQCEK